MSLAANDPPPTNIKKHAASGFVYSGVSQATKVLTQLLSVVVMARLLEPADFGLMAMVAPVYALACMFGDLGISQAVLQRPSLSHAQNNTFFWLNVFVGIGFTLLLFAVSPLVGWFYGDSRVVSLTVAMAVLVALGGLGNQHGALMLRQMDFRSQAIISISSSLLGLVGSIVAGLLLKSYWALFIGMALTTIASTIGVWIKVKWRPSWPSWAAGSGKMLRYGLGITTGNLITFLVQNLASVLIGRMFGGHLLGLFDRAGKLLATPIQQLTAPISGVMVPILYRLQDDDQRYRRVFLRTTSSLVFMLAPGVVWAIMSAEPLIDYLLGAKWREAVPLFAALSLASLPQLINGSARWLLVTQGRSTDYAKWSLWNGIFAIVSLLIGLPFGILGVAVARVVHQFSVTPLYWCYACRVGPVKAHHVLLALTPQLVGVITSGIGMWLWNEHSPGGEWWVLVSGLLLCYALNILTMAIFSQGRAALVNDFEFGWYLLRQLKRRAHE